MATLVARRWGERAGGAVSAFPAIVGPVLLVVALAIGRGRSPVGLVVAAASLGFAYRALPRPLCVPAAPAHGRSLGIAPRMATAALLVVLLSTAAGALGPVAGGMLAALPVL